MKTIKTLPVLLAGILISLMFIPGCKEASKQETASHDVNHTTLVLELNNGAKWQVDEPTRKNYNSIKAIVNDEAAVKANGYTWLATQLQDKVNVLLQECKMQGAAHEALHTWLEHFISDIKKLKNVETANDTTYNAVRQDVADFDKYFS
ncbi:MAG: hypothetical protein ACM3VS_13180 [Candidatus Dadabacteria bacterium]